MSSRKLSLSEANFLSASSNASSLSPDPPTAFPTLIVVLLLLLAGVLGSMMLPILFLASKLYRGLLLAVGSVGEVGECGESGLLSFVTNASSSSIVSSTGAGEGDTTSLSS
jgi:hypothetical protein